MIQNPHQFSEDVERDWISQIPAQKVARDIFDNRLQVDPDLFYRRIYAYIEAVTILPGTDYALIAQVDCKLGGTVKARFPFSIGRDISETILIGPISNAFANTQAPNSRIVTFNQPFGAYSNSSGAVLSPLVVAGRFDRVDVSITKWEASGGSLAGIRCYVAVRSDFERF
jgi:hypothetical protein